MIHKLQHLTAQQNITIFNISYAEEVSIEDEVLVQESNGILPAKISNLIMQGDLLKHSK